MAGLNAEKIERKQNHIDVLKFSSGRGIGRLFGTRERLNATD